MNSRQRRKHNRKHPDSVFRKVKPVGRPLLVSGPARIVYTPRIESTDPRMDEPVHAHDRLQFAAALIGGIADLGGVDVHAMRQFFNARRKP